MEHPQIRVQTSRGIIHIITSSRQYGHRRSPSMILAEQSAQAQRCPQGTAACDFGWVKQIMHVDSPPRVDSGTAGRPVSKLASDRGTAARGATSSSPSPSPSSLARSSATSASSSAAASASQDGRAARATRRRRGSAMCHAPGGRPCRPGRCRWPRSGSRVPRRQEVAHAHKE